MSPDTDTKNWWSDTGHPTSAQHWQSHSQVDAGHYAKFRVDARHSDPPSRALKMRREKRLANAPSLPSMDLFQIWRRKTKKAKMALVVCNPAPLFSRGIKIVLLWASPRGTVLASFFAILCDHVTCWSQKQTLLLIMSGYWGIKQELNCNKSALFSQGRDIKEAQSIYSYSCLNRIIVWAVGSSSTRWPIFPKTFLHSGWHRVLYDPCKT